MKMELQLISLFLQSVVYRSYHSRKHFADYHTDTQPDQIKKKDQRTTKELVNNESDNLPSMQKWSMPMHQGIRVPMRQQ